MRVAIFGSRKPERDWLIRGTEDEFIAGAEDLGQRLAALEQTIIVGGHTRRTADLHVVNGFVAEAIKNPRSRARIEVVRPDDDVAPYEQHVQRAPYLFQPHPRTEGKWRGAHLTAIAQADVVMTFCGTDSTYYAGVATILARKPLIPLASFGGASDQLLNLASAAAEPKLQPQYRTLFNPWSSHVRDTALELGSLAGGPKLLLIHGRSDDVRRLQNWLAAERSLSDVLVMGQQFTGSDSLPEKFEKLARKVHGAIALATPDDIGYPVGAEDRNQRARQNVWLEVGWFWGRLGRGRLIVLKRGDIEIPSDLQGVELFGYKDDPTERANSIREFLKSIS